MGFLKFILVLVFAWFAFRLVWWLVWPYVTKWLMQRVARSLQDQVRRQQNAQQANYQPYEQEIRLDDNLHARVRPPASRNPGPSPKPNWTQAAEDVDFEELK